MNKHLDCDILIDEINILTRLNLNLAIKQGLNQDDVDRLKFLHIGKYNLIKQMEQTDDKYLLRMFGGMITLIEFELQRSWKFPMDKKFHRFWDLPKCSCPKIDNDDRYPTGIYVTSQNCPIHGWE